MSREGKEFVDRTRHAAFTADERIEALAGLAQVAQRSPQREPVRIDEIAQGILERLRASDPDHDAEAYIEDDLEAHGDPVLLEVLMENLLENAWAFTKDESSPRIVVERRNDVDSPSFRIKDNGIGIPEDHQDAIFDAFEQGVTSLDTERRGMGLTVAQRIVALHGGTIGVESQDGEGATFWFTLPEPSKDSREDRAMVRA